MIVTINNLNYTIYNKTLFSNLSLTIADGSVILVTGKNGSGKTSFLKIFAGLSNNYQGEIEFDDDYEIAYLSAENCLMDELTVLDNLLYWSEIYDSYDKLASIIAYFHLNDLLELECKYLSTGQAKRVSLARIMMSNANIWLLDEPEANLDIVSQNLLINLVISRANQQGIIIIATNNPEIYKLDKILNLEDFGLAYESF